MSGVIASVRRLALPAALILGLTGCTTGPPDPTPTPTPQASVAPLRGTPLDPSSAQRPSLAVKIDNHPDARPQAGLERADLVFEELVEGGLTRYAAIWHSDVPDSVGPVRSIRPMDPEILSSLGGIVAYSGGHPQFVEAMEETGLLNLVFDRDDTDLFARSDLREPPHNVYLAAADAVEEHADLPPPERQFDYSGSAAQATPASAGTPTSALTLRFSPSAVRSWTWTAEAQSYLRGQDGSADPDTTGTPLRATNVVVLRVAVDRSTDVPRTLLTGSGEAWVSVNGTTMPGTWQKSAADAPIRLLDAAGATVRLAPGNTWIELVPADDGSVELAP